MHVDLSLGEQYREASGMIDKRTLEKYEKDAKEAGRDSWYLSWALDTNAEERAKVTSCAHLLSSERL